MSCKHCNQSNKDRKVVWDGEPGEYHIEVADGYYNLYGVKYCPYCGEDLSKRKEDSKKCVFTIQQEVQYDMMTLGPAKYLEKLTNKMMDWGPAEYGDKE